MFYKNYICNGLYLKGPLPWDWVTRCAAVRPHGLFVALWIWQQMDIQKAGRIKLPLRTVARQLGTSRDSVSRSLAALGEKELIGLDYHRGRAVEVWVPQEIRDFKI